MPVRRVVMKLSTQGPATCNGTVARFVVGGLEDVETGEKAGSTQKREKGAPEKVRWPSKGLVRVYSYVGREYSS